MIELNPLTEIPSVKLARFGDTAPFSHWRCIETDMGAAYPQSFLPPGIIAAFWAVISTRFAFSGKIAAKKGLISLMRVQKSGFGPLFPKIRPQKTAISHRRDEFDKIRPQMALIHSPGFKGRRLRPLDPSG
ncbi:hypothetical protein [Paenibacillus faecis]|uniref:hypothetical protein n=1 Tax=Paenibacillus faecis TaxID=862114 RepID=UPI001BCB30FC|nr:hypothetical protein [Paenibacillus faecis]